jgi:hypothetical protein
MTPPEPLTLDVREFLEGGIDPFSQIMAECAYFHAVVRPAAPVQKAPKRVAHRDIWMGLFSLKSLAFVVGADELKKWALVNNPWVN